MENIVKKTNKVIKKAGQIIIRNIGNWKSLSYKNDINLVTDIDKKVESYIVDSLKKIKPGVEILSEELYHTEQEYKSKNKWIIDPLDGTTNFVHGFPFFCVSIALMLDSKICYGSVYDPIRKELFSAVKDKGAFLNNQLIKVSKINDLKKSLLATGFAYGFKNHKDDNISHFIDFLKASRAIRRAGAAALDMCYVACGRLDGFWELYLSPWDTAAGSLIVSEAGGEVSDFKNSDYSPYNQSIIASNSLIHKKMINIINNS